MLLAPSLEIGGAERQLVVLANGLAVRGHEVSVALFRAKGGLLDLLNSAVSIVDLEKKGRSDLLGFLFRLRRLVKRENPVVVYSFLGVPNLSTLALKGLGKPLYLVWGLRASDMDMSRYDALSRWCTYAEAKLARFADRIIVNSEAGRKHAAAAGVPLGAIEVVFNGIDTDSFKPGLAAGKALRQEWIGQVNATLIGLVGRFDPMKDHETFLRAAAIATAQDKMLRFVCIGGGPLEAYLRKACDGLGLRDSVIWAGTHSDMPAVYNALDICCLSSAFGEGFPNVLGEAMSCGVPCITTDVGDAPHVVGDTGIIVPVSNPEALAEAVLEMAGRISDDRIPDTRERIIEHFSVEKMVDATEQILRTSCR